MILDSEFKALTAIIQALLPLQPAARERILRYAIDYSRDELGDGPTTTTNGATSRQTTAPAPQPAAQPPAPAAQPPAPAAQPALVAGAAPQQAPAGAGPDNPFAGM